MPRITDSTFVVVANGNPGSPPASGVRDFLVAAGARRVTSIFHPLSADEGGLHVVTVHEHGELTSRRELHRPSRPPLTYALDAVVPVRRGRADTLIGFNNLAAAHGLARRRLGLVGSVVLWSVDFVPERFGAGTPLTKLYDRLDEYVARRVDLRVELTANALAARAERLGLDVGEAAPAHVAPVGIWLDRIETAPEDGWRGRRVVFIGHLVQRQGVDTLLEAIALVPDVMLDIAGRGPEEDALRAQADRLGIADRITWHGFLSDHREVDRLVASASVAAATYSTEGASFTRYADPSKLRSYTGAGVPIVVTDVPPNASELAEQAGAELVADDPRSIADGITAILRTPEEWQRRRADALSYSQGFDWRRIVGGTLERLGYED